MLSWLVFGRIVPKHLNHLNSAQEFWPVPPDRTGEVE